MAAQTILIAEDDPDIRDGVRILLAGEGYHILEAENGTRALEIFNPEVDLVILDIMMPKLDGLEVLRRLRPDLVVERFASEAPPRYHYGRNWGLIRNETLLAMLEKRLEERNAYQGEIFVSLQSL